MNQKMEILLFMDDLKKGTKLILFLFVGNNMKDLWCQWFINLILFIVMFKKHVLNLDLHNCNYILIYYVYNFLCISRYVYYTYWICIVFGSLIVYVDLSFWPDKKYQIATRKNIHAVLNLLINSSFLRLYRWKDKYINSNTTKNESRSLKQQK